MLTKQENELLSAVGPGTPCGDYFRRFWHPIAVADEVKERPMRLRILGEDLVLFRDGSGGFGLVHPRCPHRGASLEYGYAEDGGLRCRYHGWLFDSTGRCLEQPAEPPERTFKDRVRIEAFPAKELGGFIFAYLGSGQPPVLPRLNALVRTDGQRIAAKAFLWPCNYLQVMENGALDPWHTFFAHKYSVTRYAFKEGAQKIWFKESEVGIGTLQVRAAGNAGLYVRENHVMMPNISQLALRPMRTLQPGEEGLNPAETIIWRVPVDDLTTVGFRLDFVETNGGSADVYARYLHDVALPELWAASWPPPLTPEGDVPKVVPYEDAVVTISQGRVSERWKEHLGVSDREVILYRQMLRQGIEGSKNGGKLKGLISEDREVRLPTRDGFVKMENGNDPSIEIDKIGEQWLRTKENFFA